MQSKWTYFVSFGVLQQIRVRRSAGEFVASKQMQQMVFTCSGVG
jgi:hypothetical protein